MRRNIDVERCLSFIKCQLHPEGNVMIAESGTKPAVTISRMTGCGGYTVATKLAEYLQTHVPVSCQWTVFDRNLMEKVLEDHHLHKSIAGFMAEKHKPMVADIVEELLGLHPSAWTLVQQTTETLWHLALMGNVILVGRGANVITQHLENVFHVRLIGSIERRTKRIQEVKGLDPHAALKFLKKGDKERRRYVKEHFHEDIDDPSLYHLTINTDRIPHDEAVRLIGDVVINRSQQDRRAVAVPS